MSAAVASAGASTVASVAEAAPAAATLADVAGALTAIVNPAAAATAVLPAASTTNESTKHVELRRKIREAFSVFDNDSNMMAEDREIGTIIRSLGVNPSEAKLRDLISEMEDEEPSGFIRYQDFERVILRILVDGDMPRDSEEQITRAFAALDPTGRGYVDPEELETLLTSQGEPLTKEEVDDMLSAAVDPETGMINYEDYAAVLAGDQA